MPVPVIGLPFTVLNFSVQPTIRCNCERGGVVTLFAMQRNAGWLRTQDACPSCGKLFTIAAVTVDKQDQIQFSIEMGVPIDGAQLVSQ